MNLYPNSYTIVENILTIYSDVDDPIGIIDDGITQLIFSNDYCSYHLDNYVPDEFDDPHYFHDHLSDCCFSGIFSKFNKPISLTDSLTHVTFGTKFNQLPSK